MTALLLAALLGARGVKTRYMRGIVELTPAQFKSAMGAYTSLLGALRMAGSGGIPLAEVVNSRKQPVGVEMGTVWVQAYLRPAVKQKARWTALDAYLKPLKFIAPVNFAKTAGVTNAIVKNLAATAKSDKSLPAITSLNGAAISSRMSSWHAKLAAKVQVMARQGKTVGDYFGALENVPAPPKLAGSEGKILKVVTQTTALPAGDYDVVAVTVGSDISLNIRMDLLSTQRLTVGYVPASAADGATITKDGGLYKTPPFSVSLKPVVYLGGKAEAIGAPVQFGYTELLTYSYAEPDGFPTPGGTHYLPVGGYAAFGMSTGPVIGGELDMDLPAWKATTRELAAGGTVAVDDILGEILTMHARQYYGMMDAADLGVANQLGTRLVARPREMFMSYVPAFQFSGSNPVAVNGSGMNMDLQSVSLSVGSAAGSISAMKTTLALAGMISSRLEAVIFQSAEQTPAISTVSLLAAAVTHGTPIAVVDSRNAATTPGKLALPAAIQQDIKTAASHGYLVLVTSKQVTSHMWSGAVWANISPAGFGYEIAGGLSGGSTTEQTPQMDLFESMLDGMSSLGPSAGKVTGAVAKNVARALGPVGLGISAQQALDTEEDVFRQTGDPLKAYEAKLASFGVSLATGLAIGSFADLLIAGVGTATVSVPLLIAVGAVGVLTAFAITLVGDAISKALVDAIKKAK